MSQKIICYKCEAKFEIPDHFKPLSKINCHECGASITVPYIIGNLVLESLISESQHYKTYKAYQTNGGKNLVVRTAEGKAIQDFKEKAVKQLGLINANDGNELLITELDDKLLFVRPNYQQSLARYLKEKRPTAESAYMTLLSVTEQLEKSAKEELFLKDLKLENIYVDDSGKIILTDLSIDWFFQQPEAKYDADLKSGLQAYKEVVYEILCGKTLNDENDKNITVKLRDAAPQDFQDFLFELVQKNSVFQNFEDCLKFLKKLDMKKPPESKKADNEQKSPTKQTPKKENQNYKLKSKNILKRNRKKLSATLPLLMAGLVVIGLVAFVLFKNSKSAPIENPVIAKKTKEIKKKKEKPKQETEALARALAEALAETETVNEETATPLKKDEDSVDMKGQISLLTFHEIMEAKCTSCHGQEGQKVKGKFNLVKLLNSKGVHNKQWAAMYKQVENGEMPPEDETPLTEDEKLIVLSELRNMTSQTEVTRTTRPLTPDEIKNTLIDMFQIDEKSYNPFAPLYANYGQDDFYSVQKNVITPYYIDDLYEIIHDTLESFVALNPVTKPINPRIKIIPKIQLQVPNDSRYDLRWGGGDKTFVQMSFQNRSASKEDGRKKDKSGPSSDVEEGLAKLSLPPGSYKLSFEARAVNLDRKVDKKKYGNTVSEIFKAVSKKHDYSLPVEFFLHPPGQNDPYARLKHISTVEIDSAKMSHYTVKFTIDRRNGLGYRFPLNTMPKTGTIINSIAKHIAAGRPVKPKDISNVNKKFILNKGYEFPLVRFRNFKIEGPFNVKTSAYSIADDERMNNTTIREKFRNLHNDNLIQMNMSYDYIFDKFRGRQIEQEESYRNSLVAFFLSTDFLTLKYDKKDSRKHARMLSYVFHKSTPSKALNEQFQKAIKNKSSSEFTEWIVNHPNFERYVESFTKQWLHLSHVLNAMPDRRRFERFYSNNLMKSYSEEAKQFLLYLIRKNRPVKEIVSANYSIVNNDLISFYGGGKKHQQDGFKKHTFSNKMRGGILASGAFLTATGNGVEQLPIKRAEWILTNLLDSHLPPPPEDIDTGKFQQDLSAPLHKRLSIHSEHPACYSCHKKIDPLAIMMNGFNTIGGLDHQSRSTKVKLNDSVIRNFVEFKEYIGSQEEAVARSFVKTILKYSLGRDLYVQDAKNLDKIIDENKDDNFPMMNLMKSIMKYYFF